MKLRNFLIGMGSVLDLCPARDVRRIKLTLPDDTEAIRSDWQVIGDDMRAVVGKEIERTTDD